MSMSIQRASMPETVRSTLQKIKERQQATWAAGDFSIIGVTLQIVGETLCEAVDLQAGERVLDVACGNGNATLAAARRWGRVTGVDFVRSLLEKADLRAHAEGLTVDLREGDAEALPCVDGAFDVVLSTFGAMFAVDHARTAAELLRVCRSGGRIGLASWTPEGFIGDLFRLVARYVPPPPGPPSPLLWGTREHVEELFGDEVVSVEAAKRSFVFRYESPAHFVHVFRSFYGPTFRAFETLDEPSRASLAAEMEDLLRKHDRSRGKALAVPAEYLEVVAVRR